MRTRPTPDGLRSRGLLLFLPIPRAFSSIRGVTHATFKSCDVLHPKHCHTKAHPHHHSSSSQHHNNNIHRANNILHPTNNNSSCHLPPPPPTFNPPLISQSVTRIIYRDFIGEFETRQTRKRALAVVFVLSSHLRMMMMMMMYYFTMIINQISSIGCIQKYDD